jgi:hypothetical protein
MRLLSGPVQGRPILPLTSAHWPACISTLTPATKPATAEAAELHGYAKQTGLCRCGCTVDRHSLLRPYLEQLDGASGLFEGSGTIDMQNELAALAISQTRVSVEVQSALLM